MSCKFYVVFLKMGFYVLEKKETVCRPLSVFMFTYFPTIIMFIPEQYERENFISFYHHHIGTSKLLLKLVDHKL